MSTLGYLRGTLKLELENGTVNLGQVSLPLTARVIPSHSSASDEVAVEIRADLDEVRDFIQQVFNGKAAKAEARS